MPKQPPARPTATPATPTDEVVRCTVCGAVISSTHKTTNPLPKPADPKPANQCKWCGKVHEGFFQKIVGFFHNIFAAIFGAKY